MIIPIKQNLLDFPSLIAILQSVTVPILENNYVSFVYSMLLGIFLIIKRLIECIF
jgi:hypothetical protein